jgi:hypothetical protein
VLQVQAAAPALPAQGFEAPGHAPLATTAVHPSAFAPQVTKVVAD